MSSLLNQLPKFFYNQLFVTPELPKNDCTGTTVIVTGANTGLGKEAARHIVKLNAEKVIITSRDASKGAAAAKDIEDSTGKTGIVEVWNLDLQDYDNVKAFAERVSGLKRLDAIIENAGINTTTFKEAAGNESTITVNVVSTFLLALLVLPKLQETARKFNVVPNLTIVSSEVHFFTAFPEYKSPSIFETLNDPKTANMGDRYNVSKLLEVFACRRIARKNPIDRLHVTLNFCNPGLCHSELAREIQDSALGPVFKGIMYLLARTTEVGSRTLVHAGITAGQESHGEFLSNCTVTTPAKIVINEGGIDLEERVWQELSGKLEQIQPGVTQIVAG